MLKEVGRETNKQKTERRLLGSISFVCVCVPVIICFCSFEVGHIVDVSKMLRLKESYYCYSYCLSITPIQQEDVMV